MISNNPTSNSRPKPVILATQESYSTDALTQQTMQSPAPVPRKRRRPARSCVECRRRKVRCDRKKPCGQCVAQNSPSCDFAVNVHYSSLLTSTSLPETIEEQQHILPTPNTSSIHHDASIASSPQSSTPSSRPIRGSQSKTRVFGHGHWMSTMPTVSKSSHTFADSQTCMMANSLV